MKVEANRPCLVCGSERSTPLLERTYPIYRYPGRFSIRRCEGCGLLFNSPRLRDRELFQLYDDNYYFFQRHDSDEMARIVRIYQRTMALLPKGTNTQRVAEVGSAKGYLLALLQEMGCQVQGIEVSKEAAEYAESFFHVPTFNGTVEDYVALAPADTFDIVLAIDVLEHVPDPRTFLGAIDQLLKDDGILILDTPNASAANIGVLRENWEGFNPFHIVLFTRHNLASLLTSMGYGIERDFSYGNQMADRRPRSVKSRLRAAVIPLLLRTGMFGPCQRLYKRIGKRLRSPAPARDVLLRDAVEAVRTGPSYLGTADATDALSRDALGDSLVVIARKARR